MRHIYQIEESLWETYSEDNYYRSLINEDEYNLYLDFLRELGVDFVIHELGGISEYQLSLSI